MCDKVVCERWSVTKLWELAAWEADGGGAEAGRDIESKTRTSHKDVGNMLFINARVSWGLLTCTFRYLENYKML